MKKRDSYLNLFEKQENTISDCVWANGARGSMCLSKQGKELLYRFLEMPNGMDMEKKKHIKKYGITGPIVADGIVARWIYRRPHTPLQTIYAENSVDDSQSFIRKNQSRPDMEGKILFQKAYEYCIKQEADKIRTSYWVFSFVSEDDQAMLRSLIDGYLLFLYKLAGMENLDKTLDLQVLRHIANGRGIMLPEGMEDYIFNATCDRLERNGYIKVAWVEGHTPEDVRLLDKGKAYLKQIERKTNGNDEMSDNSKNNISMYVDEIAQLKKQLAEKDNIIMLKNSQCDSLKKEIESLKDNGTNKYIYKISKGKQIELTERERNIIEYVIHCVALQQNDGKLSANIKRLIGKERTVSSHFNDSVKGLERQLREEQKQHIKTVLDGIGIDYGELLKNHL